MGERVELEQHRHYCWVLMSWLAHVVCLLRLLLIVSPLIQATSAAALALCMYWQWPVTKPCHSVHPHYM